MRGATEAARRTLSFPSDATVGEIKFAALRSFLANAPSLFRIPLHRTVSPTIAHAGDRGSASSRIALPKPSRVDELPMSAHNKYGAKYLDLQCLFWSFLDSRKSPVKACESGIRRHRQQDAHPPNHTSRLTSHKVGYCGSSAMANRQTSITSGVPPVSYTHLTLPTTHDV